MFERRHFDWLASWAGQNITPKAAQSLSTALATDNPRFRKDRFLEEYNRVRNAVRARSQVWNEVARHLQLDIDGVIKP